MLLSVDDWRTIYLCGASFQWAPTLGGECYARFPRPRTRDHDTGSFNGHPPLGVNATNSTAQEDKTMVSLFQWAPTLGGGCYQLTVGTITTNRLNACFNGHPPLGVNATASIVYLICTARLGFNGHPPLGVNATYFDCSAVCLNPETAFQWAPTLGGECYTEWYRVRRTSIQRVFQWAPTLGGECY